MKNRLLILGASGFQVPFIKKAKELGADVGIVDIDKEAPGIEFADEFFNCSLLEKDKILEIAKKFRAEGITVGTCETGVVTAAYVAEKLKLPFYSLEVARCATDKILMIEAFFKNNVAAPKYEVIRQGDEIKTNIAYPVITKPADKSASRGIYYVECEEDLQDAVKISMGASDSKEVLIEEYMEGPEISVELAIEENNPIALQITDKITNGAPYYVEVGQAQPASLSDELKNKVIELACSAAKAVGLTNCAGHAEIKLTPSGPKMIEIGGRMGGHYVDAELLENSTGYKLQETIIRYALGEEFVLQSIEPKGATAMKCILSEEGTIKKIEGVDLAERIPGILKVVIKCKVGDFCHKGTSNNDLVVFVVACSETKEKALTICDKALKKIVIEYE